MRVWLERVGLGRLLVLGCSGLLLLVFIGGPLGVLLIEAIGAGPEVWSGAIGSAVNRQAALHTLQLALGTLAFTLVLGIPLGWLFGASDLPRRDTWRALCTLPYVIPPYIGAIAWIHLANPSSGALNKSFGGQVFNIYSVPGMVWVLGLAFTPFIFMAVASSLERMDPTLEEAARISGAGPLRVFFGITLPLSLPAVASAASFVTAASAASFGVPYLLSTGAAQPRWVLTTRIYQALDLSPATGRPLAVALSIGLLVIGVGLPTLGRLLEGSRSFTTVTGKAARGGRWSLGGWRIPAQVFVGLYALMGVILPLGTLLATSLMENLGGGLALENLSFDNYVKVLTGDQAPHALFNSLILAGGAASAGVVLGTFVAYLRERTNTPGRGFLAWLSALPYAVPGTVLSLGFILAFSQPISLVVAENLRFTLELKDTLWILGLAYMVKFLAFPVGNARSGLLALHPSLEEAARMSGASWGKALRDVTFPLLRPNLVAAWLLVFLPAFSEITMSILLFGPDTPVVGTLLFNLQAYGDPPGAAVLAVLVAALVLGGNLLARRLSGGKVGL